MSTKAYTGLSFIQQNLTIGQTLSLLEPMRPLVHELLQVELEKAWARYLVGISDPLLIKNTPLSKIKRKINKCYYQFLKDNQQAEISPYRDGFHDFTCSLGITQIPNGRTLLLLNCEHNSIYDKLKDTLPLIPYHYWNNADPDTSVPPQDWQQRGLDWDSIPDQWVRYDFDTPRSCTAATLKHIPTTAARAARVARSDLAATSSSSAKRLDLRRELYHKQETFLTRDPEGIELCKQHAEKLEPLLIPLTADLVRGTTY